VEPVTLSPLLELLSNIFERLEQEEEALKVIKYAVSVLSRTVGVVHEETIRVLLDMLRLQIRISNTKEGYREGARMATEISKYLDALIKTNKDAAQMFAKKVAELLSLSRLLEHGDIELPTISSTLRGASALPTKRSVPNGGGNSGVGPASSSSRRSRKDGGASLKTSSSFSSNRNVENSPYRSAKSKASGAVGTGQGRIVTPVEVTPKSSIINSLSYRKYLK
jgi:hypothetical protein